MAPAKSVGAGERPGKAAGRERLTALGGMMNLPRSNLSSAPMALVCAGGCTTGGDVAATSRTTGAAGGEVAATTRTTGPLAGAAFNRWCDRDRTNTTSAMPAVVTFFRRPSWSNVLIPCRSGTGYGHSMNGTLVSEKALKRESTNRRRRPGALFVDPHTARQARPQQLNRFRLIHGTFAAV